MAVSGVLHGGPWLHLIVGKVEVGLGRRLIVGTGRIVRFRTRRSVRLLVLIVESDRGSCRRFATPADRTLFARPQLARNVERLADIVAREVAGGMGEDNERRTVGPTLG